MKLIKCRRLIKLPIILGLTTIIVLIVGNYWLTRAIAITPVEDIPEEILRTEIITVGRSPLDGKLLTAAEYAELQAQLQISPPPKLNSQIREQVFLLQIRKTLLQLFPFLNI
ncbi:MAG: hypothetical protein F6K62_17130 [Sphaerospermopsis sp. SIO1G2]|nr:hypothetical protein [Sphaerospermopsis sp. SIO1G1]NET72583.1 hypothetical protein [Sphaerospermopsis sp. SIO1G2]